MELQRDIVQSRTACQWPITGTLIIYYAADLQMNTRFSPLPSCSVVTVGDIANIRNTYKEETPHFLKVHISSNTPFSNLW